MKIADKEIGCNHKPFIIAEMSGNHNRSLDHALKIVDAAAESGVDALKLQTYTPDTMTLNVDRGEFLISDKDSLWQGRTLYDLYSEAQTPWDWHKLILEKAKEKGIIVFSTPFDDTSIDFLEALDVPCYKIASFENTDLPLIRKVAATGKPLIISTGMATVTELAETVDTARNNGCEDLILLKCTSSYPASPEDSNLLTIPHMRELFGCEVGISDHTMGVGVPVASIALGATVIEKHFTIDRSAGGVDSAFSMEPGEMQELVDESAKVWQAMGQVSYGPTNAEKKSLTFRRSLYFSSDIKKGERVSENNVRSVRPGLGLAPRYLEVIVGMTVTKDVKSGTPVDWSLFRM